MPERVLVVAAHPDDEVLGAGATIARHADRGDRVAVLILGEGISSRLVRRSTELMLPHQGDFKRLKREMLAAHRRMAVHRTVHHDLPDNRFDSVDLLEIVKRVESEVRRFKPQIVYTHHGGDLNIDHRLVSEAVLAACRPTEPPFVERVLAFEVLSSTEWAPPLAGRVFAPNVFVDIAPFLSAKLAAMRCYRSELRAFPHPRSLKALEAQARLWGAKAGFQAAEAFMLLRERVPAG